jgi:hypothetical protein
VLRRPIETNRLIGQAKVSRAFANIAKPATAGPAWRGKEN